jgi:Zn-dependent protease with chaperone function
MTLLSGTYYDGFHSSGYGATLDVGPTHTILAYEQGQICIDTNDLLIEAPLGNMPRKLHWSGQGSFVAPPTQALDELETSISRSSLIGRVAGMEKRLNVIVAAAIVTAIFVVGFGLYGVPKIAEGTAYLLPDQISTALGSATLDNLDVSLTKSALPIERQQQLRDYFNGAAEIDQLQFRGAKKIGANAFTLSKTNMIFTDELVQLAANDEELLAVYLHELGHAKLMHVERSILQSVAWAVVLTVVTGDIGGVGELILALPLTLGQAAFSRKYEREADEFAVAKLKELGISPLVMAAVLQRIESSHTGLKIKAPSTLSTDAEKDIALEDQAGRDALQQNTKSHSNGEEPDKFVKQLLLFLSSHPYTSERLAYIRRAAQSGDQ